MIVVFDAQCLLCSASVQFLLKRDRRGALQFASIQGELGRQLLAKEGLAVDGLQTLLVVDKGHVWQHTEALFRVLDALGGPWRLVGLARLIPAFVRDPLYRWLARNRYRMFGRTSTCMVPPSDYKSRFLD